MIVLPIRVGAIQDTLHLPCRTRWCASRGRRRLPRGKMTGCESGVLCRSYRTCRRAVSNGVVRKIALSEDSLVAVVDRFHAVLVFHIAWWQAPDNFLRAWRSCPEARSCLDDQTGTEFVR